LPVLGPCSRSKNGSFPKSSNMCTKFLCTRCFAPTNVTSAAPAAQLHAQVPAHLSGDTSRFIVRGGDRSVHLFERPARTPAARGAASLPQVTQLAPPGAAGGLFFLLSACYNCLPRGWPHRYDASMSHCDCMAEVGTAISGIEREVAPRQPVKLF
jgi:hypothetical protein